MGQTCDLGTAAGWGGGMMTGEPGEDDVGVSEWWPAPTMWGRLKVDGWRTHLWTLVIVTPLCLTGTEGSCVDT